MTDTPLAAYAAHDDLTLGRDHAEPSKEHDSRETFERDRDRIIHSSAFRRLEYKTQVFVNHEGDYYRTRLTHSIEVAQISRSIAKLLGLNEHLAEALALAHDLGHTPFGHAGEDALNEMMAEDGGFEHNLQSLRVVTILEDRYPNFRGLNLSFEVREGIVKHSSYFDNPDHQRFSEYHPEWQPTLEAQLINLTDAIAYLNHDIDDGLESGILKWEELDELAIWRQVKEAVKKKYGESISPHHMKSMAVSHLISFYINDLAEATRRNLTEVGVETLDDVRQAGRLLVTHTAEGKELQAQVRHHLSERLYQHHRLEMLRFQAHRTIQRLFEAYDSFPTMLPPSYRELNEKYGKRRAIADYIASMTDRYALQEYGRLFESPFPSS